MELQQPETPNKKKFKKVFTVTQKQKSLKTFLYFYHEMKISKVFHCPLKAKILGHLIKKIQNIFYSH